MVSRLQTPVRNIVRNVVIFPTGSNLAGEAIIDNLYHFFLSSIARGHFEKTFSVSDLRKADTIYALVPMGTIVNIFALRYSIKIRQ